MASPVPLLRSTQQLPLRRERRNTYKWQGPRRPWRRGYASSFAAAAALVIVGFLLAQRSAPGLLRCDPSLAGTGYNHLRFGIGYATRLERLGPGERLFANGDMRGKAAGSFVIEWPATSGEGPRDECTVRIVDLALDRSPLEMTDRTEVKFSTQENSDEGVRPGSPKRRSLACCARPRRKPRSRSRGGVMASQMRPTATGTLATAAWTGMDVSQLRRLKELAAEITRLTRMDADLSLTHHALPEVVARKP